MAILREGGNAVDAAIATAVTLTVVQPGSNDIGGDLFAQVWDGTSLYGLNGSGRTPQKLGLNVWQNATERTFGWLPVSVPGAPAGWRDLHERFGRLPFERLFADAIRYAEHGFPVSPVIAAGWARVNVPDLPECREWATVYGQRPGAGELFVSHEKARTLRLIAGSHAGEFYHGEIADALDAFARETGGLLTAQDMAAHTSEWVEPISASYRGYTVHELPPNGQGVAALQALALLDGLPEHGLHEQIEAMKLAFADTFAYVGDAPMPGLLEESYVDSRRKLIGPKAIEPVPGDPVRGGTVYLAAADGEGMMVSLIQSNYMGFGSFVVLPGYGFGLQNRGADLSDDPAHPNAAGPGKRPFHTIIPGFLSRDGVPVGPFGVMGGHMQPQGHLQVVLATVDGGLDPQAALAQPRWRWERGLHVFAEPELDTDGLAERGHRVEVTRERGGFGMGQAIWRLPSGGLVAGSEPRADGQAAAW
ncbi:gamma-glutamyltransferase [Rhizocola hellebori]|uniref:Gamma-glutamyltransferase n=1 Tax=Rhizocola hellebori TaxID=1392758 RepID=A0A8J3QFJ7_9ACTN|nr:gamma-glutamyltransferase [Rhizocola hellebori]